MGFFSNLGLPEILLILAVVLLLFGAKKLPEMARSLGRSSQEFKKGLKEGQADEDESKPTAEAPPPATEPTPPPATEPAQAKTPEKTSE